MQSTRVERPEQLTLEVGRWSVGVTTLAVTVVFVLVVGMLLNSNRHNNSRAGEWRHRAIAAEEVAGGLRIVTAAEYHGYLKKFFDAAGGNKLSMAAIETLAIVAYRQPVTAPEVQEMRGKQSQAVIRNLLEKRLLRISGRKEVVGRPFLYSTTKEFLIRFGLKDLGDLPKIEDMAEALGFDPPAGLIEAVPSDEVLPLDEPDAEPPPAVEAQGQQPDPEAT